MGGQQSNQVIRYPIVTLSQNMCISKEIELWFETERLKKALRWCSITLYSIIGMPAVFVTLLSLAELTWQQQLCPTC